MPPSRSTRRLHADSPTIEIQPIPSDHGDLRRKDSVATATARTSVRDRAIKPQESESDYHIHDPAFRSEQVASEEWRRHTFATPAAGKGIRDIAISPGPAAKPPHLDQESILILKQ